jgi:hypothetical protein
MAVAEVYAVVVEIYGGAMEQACGGGVIRWFELKTLKELDKGCPDLLSERDVDDNDGDEDNSSVA